MSTLNGTRPTLDRLLRLHEPLPFHTTIDWSSFGPTMEGHEVERVCKFSRSKRFEMMNERHPRTDPTFPKSFALSNLPRAKRLFWTRDVAAWMESRAERCRKSSAEAANTPVHASSSNNQTGGQD